MVWPSLQVPSIPAQTQSQHRQYLLEPAPGSGTKRPGPATNRSIDTQTQRMRNPAFLPKFFLLGWARILPRAAGREALKGFELSLPSSLAPGLAGQARLRLELASGFRGPARGGMLPPPAAPVLPFPASTGFGWAPMVAVKKSGPVWECSKKELRETVACRGPLPSSEDPVKDRLFPSLVPERGREVS